MQKNLIEKTLEYSNICDKQSTITKMIDDIIDSITETKFVRRKTFWVDKPKTRLVEVKVIKGANKTTIQRLKKDYRKLEAKRKRLKKVLDEFNIPYENGILTLRGLVHLINTVIDEKVK